MISLVILGPPGSGKGTQAELLATGLGVAKFSMGDALRELAASGSPVGREITPIIARGDLISNEQSSEVVNAYLNKLDLTRGVVAEGIPRFIGQVEPFLAALQSRGLPDPWLIELKVSDDTTVERIAKRRICSACQHPAKPEDTVCVRCGNKLVRRSDETDEVIRNRLKIYHRQTEPVVNHFRKRGRVIEINDEPPIEHVYGQILSELKKRAIVT